MSMALISQMEPPPGEEAEFDDWYRAEHVPARMAIEGFTAASRFRKVRGEDPSHLVIYWLESPEVLETAAYRRLKEAPSRRTLHMLTSVTAFTRYIGQEIQDTGPTDPAPYVYLVTFEVPSYAQSDFDSWYEGDHLPVLLRNPAWLRCRRYSIVEGEPASVTRCAVHELLDLSALESSEREQARATQWRARLAEQEWFRTGRYSVYERFQDFEGQITGSGDR